MNKFLNFTATLAAKAPGSWKVSARSNPDALELGRVEWYPRWGKFVFAPKDGTLFDSACLREIANFCAEQTEYHRRMESAA